MRPDVAVAAATPSPRRGRPRKFSAPSRAVTLTLPERTLEALAAVDHDLSRAVVRLAQPDVDGRAFACAELEPFGRHAVIVVRPSRTLERKAGVLLVPRPDGRALISFEEAKTIPELELKLQDLVDDPELAGTDRRVLEEIAALLRDARRSGAVQVRRRHIIVFEAPARPRGPRATPRKKPTRKMSS